VITLSASIARADETRCGTTVEDLQQLNDAIADFIARPACTHIDLGGDILIRQDESDVQPIQPIIGGMIEAPELINRSLVIDGSGFTLTSGSGVSGFVIYLGSPDGSNTLTIRNLGMSGFGGSGAVSAVSGATVIERSLFTNNTFQSASPIPGMNDASAGAINAIGGLTVRESQFERNTGKSAGSLNITGTASLDFCTIVANSSTSSGAAILASEGVSVFGSITYDNDASGEVTDVHAAGPVTVTASLMTSLQSVASTPTPATFDKSTLVDQDPSLSPLGNYGGFTLPSGTKIQTRPPQINSPVLAHLPDTR
jgi:hypothetical protein